MKQNQMASKANEPMKVKYSYDEMEAMLSDCGYLVYEHLIPDEITFRYFSKYNESNPGNRMSAFPGVDYCLAVRKHENQYSV